MKLLLDMNLSPVWVQFLAVEGFEAIHWSTLGRHDAADSEIFQYAAEHELIIATNDLDFGAILAHTKSTGPSVIQVRTQDSTPIGSGHLLTSALRQFPRELQAGVSITIMPKGPKVRLLPLAKHT